MGGQVVGPWCPNFPFNILFSVIEPQGLPVFKCKTGGGAVQVEVDVNPRPTSSRATGRASSTRRARPTAATTECFLSRCFRLSVWAVTRGVFPRKGAYLYK